VLIGRGTRDDWYTEAKEAEDRAKLAKIDARVDVCVFDGGHEWTDAFRRPRQQSCAVSQPGGRASMTLADLGWDDRFAAAYEPWQSKTDVQPGRVAIEFNQIFRIYVDDGELDAVTAGRLKHRATSRAELPAVGDWVAVRKRVSEDRGVILAMLPRRSAFTRRAAVNPPANRWSPPTSTSCSSSWARR
jgi:hypothetical protein